MNLTDTYSLGLVSCVHMSESLGLPEFTWFMDSKFDHLVELYLYCGREVTQAVEGYDPWSSESHTYAEIVFFPTDLSIPSADATPNDIAYDAMMRNEILHTVGLAGMEEFSLLAMRGYSENTILRHEIKKDGACVGVFDFKKFVRNDGHELIVQYERDPTHKDRADEMCHCVRIMCPPVGILVADFFERRARGRPMEAKLGAERESVLKDLISRGWTGDAKYMTVWNLRRELVRLKWSGKG